MRQITLLRKRASLAPLAVLAAAQAMLLICAAEAAEHSVSDTTALQRAIACAGPGDTIVMADGRWRDADINFTAVGQPELPITLRAQTLGKVSLCARSRLHIGGRYLVVSRLSFTDGYVSSKKESVISFRNRRYEPAHYCRVTDCAVIKYNPPDKETDTTAYVAEVARLQVPRCALRLSPNSGEFGYNRLRS